MVHFILGDSEQDIEYESIRTMFATYLECFENGAIFKDKEGYLEEDDASQIIIAKKNNPSVKYWSTSN